MNTQETSGVIECYFSSCPHHGSLKSVNLDEGPYCYENTCNAAAEDLASLQVFYDEYLRTLPKSEAKVIPIVRKADEPICLQVKRT